MSKLKSLSLAAPLLTLLAGAASQAATDYDKARALGLTLGKTQYPDEVRQYLASLDDAFSKHDYTTFGAKMRSPGDGPKVVASLDWAQANMIMGASIIVPIIYAESLWSIGSSAPPGNALANFKDTAAMVTLYSLAVIQADAAQCADPSAPTHHRDSTAAHLRPVLNYFGQLPDDKRKQIVDFALKQEALSYPSRTHDNYLCRFGMEEITAGLKATPLEQLPHRAPQGNEVGTQVSVPSPPGFEPRYLPDETWRPKQAEARERLPASLTALSDTLHKQTTAPVQPTK